MRGWGVQAGDTGHHAPSPLAGQMTGGQLAGRMWHQATENTFHCALCTEATLHRHFALSSALYWGDVRNSWEPRSGSGALGERPRQPYAEIVRGALAARIERILMDTWIHGNLLIP